METLALDFKVYEGNASLPSYGTVKNAVGAGGKVDILESSINKTDGTRVFAVLKRANGTSVGMSCSKALSEALRAKKVKPEHLIGFNIIQSTNDKGEKFPVISMPTSRVISIEVDKLTVEEYQPETISLGDLIG